MPLSKARRRSHREQNAQNSDGDRLRAKAPTSDITGVPVIPALAMSLVQTARS